LDHTVGGPARVGSVCASLSFRNTTGYLVDRMTRLRLALGILFGMTSLLAGVTFVALEGREVALLRTVDEHGNTRNTRVWVADEDGYVWVEAANRSRPFLRDVHAIAEVELRRGGTLRRCQAVVVPNPEGDELLDDIHMVRWL
jgi:hypothetical protein